MNHPYIEYVLANYFSLAVEQDEGEAIAALKAFFSTNPDFSRGLRQEVEQTLASSDFSWCDAFETYDVESFECEESARNYCRRILVEPYS